MASNRTFQLQFMPTSIRSTGPILTAFWTSPHATNTSSSINLQNFPLYSVPNMLLILYTLYQLTVPQHTQLFSLLQLCSLTLKITKSCQLHFANVPYPFFITHLHHHCPSSYPTLIIPLSPRISSQFSICNSSHFTEHSWFISPCLVDPSILCVFILLENTFSPTCVIFYYSYCFMHLFPLLEYKLCWGVGEMQSRALCSLNPLVISTVPGH